MNFKITNTIGLVRCILALSSILVLVFNDLHLLIPENHFRYMKEFSEFHYFKGINLFLFFSYENLIIPKIISILFLLLVISGFYPRISCVIHSFISYSIYNTLLIVEGGDQINSILVMLLIPICLLDQRKNHWSGSTNITNSYLAYLCVLIVLFIKIQMAVIYLDSGIEKLKVTEWADGTALYYWFNHNIFGLSEASKEFTNWIFSNKLILNICTWSVIILEILLFGGLFANNKIKLVLFVFAALFHFLIIIVHGLPSFFLSMLSGLIIYLWNCQISIKENVGNIKQSLKYSFYEVIKFH